MVWLIASGTTDIGWADGVVGVSFYERILSLVWGSEPKPNLLTHWGFKCFGGDLFRFIFGVKKGTEVKLVETISSYIGLGLNSILVLTKEEKCVLGRAMLGSREDEGGWVWGTLWDLIEEEVVEDAVIEGRALWYLMEDHCIEAWNTNRAVNELD